MKERYSIILFYLETYRSGVIFLATCLFEMAMVLVLTLSLCILVVELIILKKNPLFRIAQQGLRKYRMQERWGNMKEEIWSILQYKDQAERKADNRPEVVCLIFVSLN